MSALSSIFTHHLKARLEYRQALLFSIFLHPLVMLLTLLVFKGIYSRQGQATLLGYTLNQMVWYFGATQFFYHLVWNTVDKTISEKVLYGRMDRELVRPSSMLTWELLQLGAQKLLCVVFEFIPVFGVYVLICYPDFLTWSGFAQYAVLTALASLQLFLMSFTLGILAFLWHDVSAAHALKLIVVNLLAGVALPAAFLPRSMQELMLLLPFHYLFHTPVSHLLGSVDVGRWDLFAHTLGRQAMWVLFFLFFARLAYQRSIARFLSAGG